MKSAMVSSLYITSNWFNLYPRRPYTQFTLCNNDKCLSDTLTKPCSSTLEGKLYMCFVQKNLMPSNFQKCYYLESLKIVVGLLLDHHT